MEPLRKLEHRILGWVKDVPHLPRDVQAWLGRNIWIIVMVGAIIGTVAVFFQFINWLALMAVISDPRSQLYVYGGVAGWSVATTIISYVFTALILVALFASVAALKNRSKRGWVLLFVAWLVFVLQTVITAVLSLNAFVFVFTLLMGAIFALIFGYVLFEVHTYFDQHKAAKPKKIIEKEPTEKA